MQVLEIMNDLQFTWLKRKPVGRVVAKTLNAMKQVWFQESKDNFKGTVFLKKCTSLKT